MDNETRTDRRIVRSKQSIKKAFLELFAEKDLEQITVNEIAERANVNRGTVYLHFADKYDLLDKCMEDHIREIVSLCTKREVHPASPGMIRDPRPVFDYFRDHFPFFSAMFSNLRAAFFRERLLHFISDSLMDKRNHPEHKQAVDKELNAQFMASAFIGIAEWWIRHRMPHSAAFMADQVKQLFEKNQVYEVDPR